MHITSSRISMKNSNITRRNFIQITGIYASATLLHPESGFSYQATSHLNPGVVDCHIHLWAPDKKRFPFHPDAPYIPEEVSSIEQYMADREGSGIDIGIHVHAEPYQDDHRYTLYCLEKDHVHMRATCLFNPNDPKSPERMENLVKGKPFVAVRVHSYSEERAPQWDSSVFRKFWEKAGELGIVLQIQLIPGYGKKLETMVKSYPDIPVLIDHLGRPAQGSPEEYESIMALHKYPNVYMKFSGLDYASKESYPFRDAWHYVHRIAELFTPKRMVWGDSYKGGMGSKEYGQSMEIVHQVLSNLSLQDRHEVLGGTARRLFKL